MSRVVPTRLVLEGGRVLDPASGRDERADVRIEDGRIVEIGPDLSGAEEGEVLDVGGLLVTPGLVDPHVHLREPGQTHKETIATGAAAAVAGGFTTVCAMPNTDPVLDSVELVRWVVERARAALADGGARVRPIAAATIDSEGERPTDATALAAAGAVALSDDGLPIEDDGVFAEVLVRTASAGLVVADHCERCDLSAGGAVFASEVARRLEVGGIPPEAESEAVARDLEMLRRVGGRLHVCHVSTAASVELLRRAKSDGLAVTAEATPHHLTLTVEAVEEFGTAAKMNPPLASAEDREAVRAALLDGTIDCVATDHAPHSAKEKKAGLATAPFGIVGLETAFGILHTELVLSGETDLATLVERMTVGAARVLDLDAGRLEEGGVADVAVFDLDQEWTVEPRHFRSKSGNTPWAGRRLVGRPVVTVVDGRVAYDDRGGAKRGRKAPGRRS